MNGSAARKGKTPPARVVLIKYRVCLFMFTVLGLYSSDTLTAADENPTVHHPKTALFF